MMGFANLVQTGSNARMRAFCIYNTFNEGERG